MASPAPLLALAISFALLATAMPVSGDLAGGVVNNKLPGIPSATGPSAINTGTPYVVSGQLTDLNGEMDLTTARATLTAPDPADNEILDLDLTGFDWTVTEEPVDYTAGWKAWNCGTERDGQVCYKFQYTFAATGSYSLAFSASDPVGFGTPTDPIAISVHEALAISDRLVLADGTLADAAARWGAWAADPGATGVLANNYVLVTNTGVIATQQFTVDFTEVAFTGVTDDTWTIAIDQKVEFACAETQADEAPEDLAFVFGAVSDSGSGTCQFTAGSTLGVGKMYVQYRLTEIQSPMMGQAYAASYTVSA